MKDGIATASKVELRECEYLGTVEVIVTMPPGTHYHRVAEAAYRIAAELEAEAGKRDPSSLVMRIDFNRFSTSDKYLFCFEFCSPGRGGDIKTRELVLDLAKLAIGLARGEQMAYLIG